MGPDGQILYEGCSLETSGGLELDQWCRVWVDRFELRETEDTIGLPGVDPSCSFNFADIIGKTPDTFPVLQDGSGVHSIQCQCQLPAPPPLPPASPPPAVKRHTFDFKADRAQCVIHPNSGEQVCINLPVGSDLNDPALIAAALRAARRG
jgi:hypothetical protein